MIGRILAATDLSARGERALGRALRLRRRFGAQLTVLHVVEDELPESIATRRAEEARELIEGQLRARGEGADLEATAVEVASGTGYAAVIERAHALGAGLTVLGSHRESSWRDLFLGSTIERVLRQGGTPVLTVKQEPAADTRACWSPSTSRSLRGGRWSSPAGWCRMVSFSSCTATICRSPVPLQAPAPRGRPAGGRDPGALQRRRARSMRALDLRR